MSFVVTIVTIVCAICAAFRGDNALPPRTARRVAVQDRVAVLIPLHHLRDGHAEKPDQVEDHLHREPIGEPTHEGGDDGDEEGSPRGVGAIFLWRPPHARANASDRVHSTRASPASATVSAPSAPLLKRRRSARSRARPRRRGSPPRRETPRRTTIFVSQGAREETRTPDASRKETAKEAPVPSAGNGVETLRRAGRRRRWWFRAEEAMPGVVLVRVGADSADEAPRRRAPSGGRSRRETRSSSPSSEAVGPPRAIAHAIGAREESRREDRSAAERAPGERRRVGLAAARRVDLSADGARRRVVSVRTSGASRGRARARAARRFATERHALTGAPSAARDGAGDDTMARCARVCRSHPPGDDDSAVSKTPTVEILYFTTSAPGIIPVIILHIGRSSRSRRRVAPAPLVHALGVAVNTVSRKIPSMRAPSIVNPNLRKFANGSTLRRQPRSRRALRGTVRTVQTTSARARSRR